VGKSVRPCKEFPSHDGTRLELFGKTNESLPYVVLFIQLPAEGQQANRPQGRPGTSANPAGTLLRTQDRSGR